MGFHERRRALEEEIPVILCRIQFRRFRKRFRVEFLNRLDLGGNHGDEERIEGAELSTASSKTVVEVHEDIGLLQLLHRRCCPGAMLCTVISRTRCTISGVAWASFSVGPDRAAPNCTGFLIAKLESLPTW